MDHTGLELIRYDDWLKIVGASRSTGFRYRRKGWVTVLNRAGHLYVTRSEAERFSERLAAGEFASEIARPRSAAGAFA